MTPIQQVGEILVKRDDLFSVHGATGGKARTCYHLATQRTTEGLITAGSRHSPQVKLVAYIAAGLHIKCRAHVPAGDLTEELKQARVMGAELIAHRPGYNSVIVARARKDAEERGWIEIPFGMECGEAVEQTALQVESLIPYRDRIKRIVAPVGSGMSFSGIVNGLIQNDLHIPLVGIQVGADPQKRLDYYCPPFSTYLLFKSVNKYGERKHGQTLGAIKLDPYYEAKCLPFLQAGDLFWIVGHR